MTFLKILGAIVVFVWLIGLIFKLFGGFIHILLFVAAIIFLIDFFTGRKND